MRLSRALQIRNRTVSDIAVPLSDVRAVPVTADGEGATVAAIRQAVIEAGHSRFPVVDSDGRFVGYVHIKDVLPAVDDPDAVVDRSTIRPLPEVPDTLPLPDALSRLKRANAHLALVTDRNGKVVAIVALDGLVDDLVGTVRDGTHRA
jgi:magnesium and cobalt exporter, CNNM family